jgi:hypothetical protein
MFIRFDLSQGIKIAIVEIAEREFVLARQALFHVMRPEAVARTMSSIRCVVCRGPREVAV